MSWDINVNLRNSLRDRSKHKYRGRPTDIIRKLKDEEIFNLGKENFNSQEEEVIRGLGVPEKSIKTTMLNKRWRFQYDKGTAVGRTEYNKKLTESKDATIQKEISKRSLPPPEVIEEGYEFVVDAPEWFIKGIGGKKSKN